MPRQVIPHDQWEHFFGHISHEYAGRMATLEMVPESEGPQLVAFDQPLEGISTADRAGRTTIAIRLGEEPAELTIETPLRVHTWPFERGGGQVVEIEAAGTPLTRLYLSHSAEQSTGRGEIFGGQAERSVGQERAPGAGITGAGEAGGDLGDPPRDYLDASSRAAGIVGEANTGGGYGPAAGRDTQRQAASNLAGAGFDAGAGRGEAEQAGVRLGIGLGGVRGMGGGSLGDRDLSGQPAGERDVLEEIADAGETVGPGSDVGASGAVSISGGDRTTGTGFSFGGDVDVADLGPGAGVIDTTRDPIGGIGGEDNGMDATDDMVEGEVGAQAERDLSKLLGRHAHGRFDPEDAQLQQRLSELIEEDDEEEDAPPA